MKTLPLLILLCAISLPAAAQASDFNYSFVDLAYSSQRTDLTTGGKGYRLEGSYAFSDHFFVEALLTHNGFNDQFFPSSKDVYHRRAGIGVHGGPSENFDFYALAAISRGRLSEHAPGYSYDIGKTAADVVIGLRARLPASLELDASLEANGNGYWNEFEGQTGIAFGIDGQATITRLGLRYAVMDQLSIGLGYANANIARHGADVTHSSEWLASARWNF